MRYPILGRPTCHTTARALDDMLQGLTALPGLCSQLTAFQDYGITGESYGQPWPGL